TLGRNRHFFGLPGNPLSVLTGLHEFVLPALRRLSGLPEEKCRATLKVRLGRAIRAKGGRTTHVLAELTWRAGQPVATPIRSHGSADLASASSADGVVVIGPRTRSLPAGRTVVFVPWRALP
ncbi:hypothetical protein LCGC14_1958650, partial [marine sediment metagenome]